VAQPYTISFGYGHIVSAADVLLMSVPQSGTYILRDLVVTNQDSGSHDIAIYMTTGQGVVYLWLLPVLEPHTSQHLQLRQVLPPGSDLRFFGNGPEMTVAATGYSLT
jgi:hypothetical protein